ncbi:hypothetical protein D3Z46_01055 [Bacteroides sartorii]|nr:hypothetical protein [Phocaeicola sartorii]
MSNKTINFSHRSTLFLFVTKYHAEMEDKNLTLKQEAQIKEKATALKAEKKVRKVCPMVVFGDRDYGENEFYVASRFQNILFHLVLNFKDDYKFVFISLPE